MHVKRLAIIGLIAVVVATTFVVAVVSAHPGGSSSASGDSGMPRYQHIFYIMMENQAYDEIVGNANAPHINALAEQYGLATSYYGVTHPSEPNYVASVGGDVYINNTVNSAQPRLLWGQLLLLLSGEHGSRLQRHDREPFHPCAVPRQPARKREPQLEDLSAEHAIRRLYRRELSGGLR